MRFRVSPWSRRRARSRWRRADDRTAALCGARTGGRLRPRARPGRLGRGAARDRRRRGLLAELPGAPRQRPRARPDTRRRDRRRPLYRRRALRDRGQDRAGRVRDGILRASVPRPAAGRRLAALRVLRDAPVEALVDRGDRRGRSVQVACRRANGGLPRLGRTRREGSDRRGRWSRYVAGVDLLPPSDGAGRRGSDDQRLRHQRRRVVLGLAR
jgi:hypothetical protein